MPKNPLTYDYAWFEEDPFTTISFRQDITQPVSKDNLSGAVRHGQRVRIVKKQLLDGVEYPFYYVTCTIEHEGKKYIQKGWISARLLKVKGAKYREGLTDDLSKMEA